jgi:hypothetical protein
VQIPPARRHAGFLDERAESRHVAQALHDPEVVRRREQSGRGGHAPPGGERHGFGTLAPAEDGGHVELRRQLRRLAAARWEAGRVEIDAQVQQVVFEIVELPVEFCNAAAYDRFSSCADRRERIAERDDRHARLAELAHDLLRPEVGVDEQLRFERQSDALEVPAGVIGGDVAEPGETADAVPLVRVPVVEARDAAFFLADAPELADVVADRGALQQRQIDRHPAGELAADPQHDGDAENVIGDREPEQSSYGVGGEEPVLLQVDEHAPILPARRPGGDVGLTQGFERRAPRWRRRRRARAARATGARGKNVAATRCTSGLASAKRSGKSRRRDSS